MPGSSIYHKNLFGALFAPIFKRDFEGARVEIDPQKMEPQNRFLTCRIHSRGQNFEIPKIDLSKKADGGSLIN